MSVWEIFKETGVSHSGVVLSKKQNIANSKPKKSLCIICEDINYVKDEVIYVCCKHHYDGLKQIDCKNIDDVLHKYNVKKNLHCSDIEIYALKYIQWIKDTPEYK